MVLAHEREHFYVLLFDRWFENGIWYYFVVLWFFKTPIALMAASIAGAWVGFRSHAFRQPGMKVLFFQWALYLAYFSLVFHAQLGYRYVLMLVPMTCLFLAVGMKDWWTKPRGAYAAIAIAVLSLAELMPYYGHALAFSNTFLLPKKDAFRVLADSNLYWNEYHAQIPKLLRERGMQAAINPVHILPGKNAFDSIELSGLFLRPLQHRWVRENLQTSGHVKHVIFLYDVSDRDFSRFLDENRRYSPPVRRPTAKARAMPRSGSRVRTKARCCCARTPPGWPTSRSACGPERRRWATPTARAAASALPSKRGRKPGSGWSPAGTCFVSAPAGGWTAVGRSAAEPLPFSGRASSPTEAGHLRAIAARDDAELVEPALERAVP